MKISRSDMKVVTVKLLASMLDVSSEQHRIALPVWGGALTRQVQISKDAQTSV